MNDTQKIRPCAIADAAIISIMACCVLATSNPLKTSRPDRVVVFRQNSVVAEYPLEDDIAFSVGGKKGPVDIEIKNGVAVILHADCPKKICKQSGGISKSHEQLICAPNNILIEVQSSADDDDVDAIAF
jgi:hypothetical protein